MNTTQNISVSVAGVNFGGVSSIEYDTAIVKEEALAAGVSTTLATRSGNSAGTLTLPGGHGLSTGRFDLYWTEGTTVYYQQGLTGTVSGDVMTLAAASVGNGGTNLPLVGKVIIASPSASFSMAVPVSSISGFFFKSNTSANALVRIVLDDDSTVGYFCPIRGAVSWVSGTSDSPLADKIVSFFASTQATESGGIAAAVIWSD